MKSECGKFGARQSEMFCRALSGTALRPPLGSWVDLPRANVRPDYPFYHRFRNRAASAGVYSIEPICLKTVTVITAWVLLGTACAQTPGDVVFELRTTRSPAVYQIGERIELEFSFSTTASGKYGIVSTSEQRDASLLNETYSISPATGAMDPRDSQRAMQWGIGGSFMSGQRALSDVPVIRHADLNEWLRVTRPGHYLLHAVSPRVFSVGEVPQFPDVTAGNHPVASNEIEITIVGADAVGLANQLAGITAHGREVLPKARRSRPEAPRFDAALVDLIAAVRAQELEGLVAKRLDSVYEPGARSGAWRKMRLNKSAEFVIGGYTRGGRTFEALVLGRYEGERIVCVARTRVGFSPASRQRLMTRLRPLEIPECPFANLPEVRSGRWGEGLTADKMKECVWVRPELLAEIEFVEWTPEGHLRHARFIALRDEIVR
jgi:hypothetical protein